MDETTLVQDIETSHRTPAFRSYREVLDDAAPGASSASQRFYRMVDGDLSEKYTTRLLDCRSSAWFVRHEDTGRVRIAAKQCRLRWCYHCSESRQQFITQAILPWYSKVKSPKLLTVTLRHNDKPLPEQIDFLYRSFAKFRNRKLLKDAIRGGIWFFQITYNQKSQQWHPHIHALLDADYMLHAELMTIWSKITDGSTIVHIRAVHDPAKTLSHNARYAARPSALIKIPESLWPELHEAFEHRKICGSWGSAKLISFKPSKPEDADKWHDIGGFRTIVALRDCDDNARAIFDAFTFGTELDESISMRNVEDQIDHEVAKKKPPPDWELEPWFEF